MFDPHRRWCLLPIGRSRPVIALSIPTHPPCPELYGLGIETLELDRIDLADIHEPERLAATIHRQLGRLVGPVPVDDIACALGVAEVRRDHLDGCEGLLLSNRVRSQGRILVNVRNGARRARFSIGHELGHYVLERHQLTDAEGFTCRGADMSEWRTDSLHHKQEAQANQFAISMLAPRYMVDPFLNGDPDIGVIQKLSDRLELSMEATARRFIQLS